MADHRFAASPTPDFEQRFAAFLTTKREVSADVDAAVRDIIADVRARGDAALIDYTLKFDRVDLAPARHRASPQDEIDAAYAASRCRRRSSALKFARDRIERITNGRRPKDDRYTDALGVELGSRWTAIEAVGLYVPGGTASYPSSVLMNAVPAKVAGVERIVMVVPAPGGVDQPAGAGRRRASPASPKSTASAARRRSRRLPMAPRRSRRSPRSSARATPMSPPPSARSSARSAST